MRSVLGVHWEDWCWNWNSNTLATSCEELTRWKRPWCWEGLGAGGEREKRGWDGWMASPTKWTWVWVNSRSWWWWTGRPGLLRFMGSQRVRHDWVTELNWNIKNMDTKAIYLLQKLSLKRKKKVQDGPAVLSHRLVLVATLMPSSLTTPDPESTHFPYQDD